MNFVRKKRLLTRPARTMQRYMQRLGVETVTMTIGQRFEKFLQNISLTTTQLADGRANQAAVRKVLNRHYWGVESETANSLLVGSWGKQTRVRPPRDIDVLFELPVSVLGRVC